MFERAKTVYALDGTTSVNGTASGVTQRISLPSFNLIIVLMRSKISTEVKIKTVGYDIA
jgi:hypothetical protein